MSAVPITAKKGSESKYLPAKNNKIIAVTERIIIPNLNIPENVFLSILEISQRTPYKIRNIINAETVTVPTGFIGVRSFYILSGGTKYHLNYITPSNLISIRGGSTAGMPRTYTIESDNGTESFRFAPQPDTSYTGYLSYYKAIPALSDSNTSNYIYSKLFRQFNLELCALCI